MSNDTISRVLALFALLFGLTARTATAQLPGVDSATYQNYVRPKCDSAAAALDAAPQSGAPRNAASFLASFCRPGSLPVIARAVRALRASGDTALIHRVYGAARAVGDTSVVAAAQSVSTDAGASTAARVYAVWVLLAVPAPGWRIVPEQFINGTAPSDCWPVVAGEPTPVERASVPTSVRDQAFTTIRSLAADAQAPAAVRAAASCASRARDASPQ